MAKTLTDELGTNTLVSPLDKVVIIGGMPRSGTNLARRLIGSHTQIGVAPVEFSLFRKRAEGMSLVDIIGAPRFQERYELDVSDLYDTDDQTAYQQLLMRYANHVGKPIAGEKSPRNEFFYDEILQFLPDSDVFFLHMVRNPFDVLASFKNAPFRGSVATDEATIESISHEWARSLSIGSVRAALNPDRYRLVVFESLTSNTDTEVASICQFLQVDSEQRRMQEMSDYAGHDDNTSFRSTDKPDNGSAKVKKLESRKNHLDAAEIEIVGKICGPLAVALGYQDADFSRNYTTAGTSQSVNKRLSGFRKLLNR